MFCPQCGADNPSDARFCMRDGAPLSAPGTAPSTGAASLPQLSFKLPVTDGSGENRASLQAAHKLLTEAGWKLEGGRLVKDGVPLSLEFLAQTRQQERLMLSYARTLERLGITLRIRQVDTPQYWSRLKTFDFDMIQWTWSASLSPGNEQINRWSSKAATIEGSLKIGRAHV